MPKKLLVADDSITIQKVMGITFASEDYDLTVVDNGAEAVIKAREIKPDLILADIVMPEKDGYEVCREIKNDPDLSATPVILLAGTFEQFDENKSSDVGADDYITKPFESQAIIEKVKSNLEKASAASDTETPAISEEPSGDILELSEEEFDEEIMELGEEDIVEATTDFSAISAGETEAQTGTSLAGTENIEAAESQDMFGEESVEDDFAEVAFDNDLEELGLGSEVDDELGILSDSDEIVEVEGMEKEEVPEEKTLHAEKEEELPLPEIAEEKSLTEEEISYPDLPETEDDKMESTEPSIGNLPDEKLEAIVSKIAKDVIEKIAWEVVPELAETLILEEIKRLKEGKSD